MNGKFDKDLTLRILNTEPQFGHRHLIPNGGLKASCPMCESGHIVKFEHLAKQSKQAEQVMFEGKIAERLIAAGIPFSMVHDTIEIHMDRADGGPIGEQDIDKLVDIIMGKASDLLPKDGC
jgi:hypothetical protein